VAQPQKPAD
jgi:serine/threonine protein kinase